MEERIAICLQNDSGVFRIKGLLPKPEHRDNGDTGGCIAEVMVPFVTSQRAGWQNCAILHNQSHTV